MSVARSSLALGLLLPAPLLSLGCHDTWQGVKSDTKRALDKTGKGLEKASDKIDGKAAKDGGRSPKDGG